MSTVPTNKNVDRRTLLKGAAGAVGLAAGSGAITGFPYVKSAEPKVLRYLGTAVNEGDEISKKCRTRASVWPRKQTISGLGSWASDSSTSLWEVSLRNALAL